MKRLYFCTLVLSSGETAAGAHFLADDAADARAIAGPDLSRTLTDEEINQGPEEMRERIRIMRDGMVLKLAGGWKVVAKTSSADPTRFAVNRAAS